LSVALYKEKDLVKILKADNPYHDVGDILPVWGVNEKAKTLICPDSSGGAVHYAFNDVCKHSNGSTIDPTHAGDQYFTESTENFTEKAHFKIANLMKHGYEMTKPEKGARVQKGTDCLIILASGEVFKKVIY